MVVAIVGNDLHVAQTPSGGYLKPYAWKSFSQWWGLFRDMRLLQTVCHFSEPPHGWLRVPDFIESRELVSYDRPLGFLHRRKLVGHNARVLLRDVKLLYVRHPSYESYYVSRVARKLGIPIVTSLHGDWHEGVLSQTNTSFLRKITRYYRANKARRIYDDLVAYSLAVITIGPALAEKYVPRDKPVLVTSNYAMEEDEFALREDFTLKTPPRILFVGVLQERKGLSYLLSALQSLKASGRDFQLVVVGDDCEQGAFRRQAEVLGLADRIRFAGVLPHGPRLFEEYRNADVLVLPSIAAEGLPRVVQEAMALGCPVIATDIGGTRWQLRDGAGILVPPRDSHALENALVQVLDDSVLRQSLSENGMRTAREHTFEKQREAIAAFVRAHVPADLFNHANRQQAIGNKERLDAE